MSTRRVILILEDDPIIGMMLQDMLRQLGCDAVGPAGSVAAGLKLLLETPMLDGAVLIATLAGRWSGRSPMRFARVACRSCSAPVMARRASFPGLLGTPLWPSLSPSESSSAHSRACVIRNRSKYAYRLGVPLRRGMLVDQLLLGPVTHGRASSCCVFHPRSHVTRGTQPSSRALRSHVLPVRTITTASNEATWDATSDR